MPTLKTRRTTKQLLRAAECDSDAASVFCLGTCLEDTERAVIVIKGRHNIQLVLGQLEFYGLLTPGKSVEGAAHG